VFNSQLSKEGKKAIPFSTSSEITDSLTDAHKKSPISVPPAKAGGYKPVTTKMSLLRGWD